MKIIFLLIFVLFNSLYSSHIKTKKLEKISLQLHWKYQFEFAGFIAAKEKGFYKDVGLDVQLKEYTFGQDIEADVLNGVSEYGIYNSLSLVEYLHGKPIKLVASFFKRAALVLVTTPDIHSPKDLVGKKIMASTKEDFILNFKPYFDGYGVSIDDVELIPHSYNIDKFAQGEVPAITAFISNEVYKLDERGIKYNILDPSDDNLYVLQMELFTSKEETTKHAKRVAAFRDASIKGWQYALSHKEELVDIIYEKYSTDASKKSMMGEAIGVEKLILPYTYDIGSIDKNFLNKQIKLFKKHYNIGAYKELDGFIFQEKREKNKIVFTPEELEYIRTKKVINLCLNYDQFPIDGYENKQFIGVMADIFSIISKKTSLRFNPIVPTSQRDLENSLKNGTCDALDIYGTKNKIFKTLLPTRSFASTHFTLISELDKSFIAYPEQLEGKTLLVQIQSSKDYLLHIYPYLSIDVVSRKDEMVKRLRTKRAYAIITLDPQSDYLIDKYGYGKLKINGFLAKNYPAGVSIGIQKSEPILHTIIDKALGNIPKDMIHSIRNSWRISRYQEETNYTMFILLVTGMGFIVVFLIYIQSKLRNFNKQLELTVDEKTKELRDINESLEIKVKDKVQELIKKDEILTVQSKQAVMGEMISMIAHQWRQPLNMITLQISNLQIKQMMGERVEDSLLKKTLDEVTSTIIYLSETVDDFKTYFHPNKELNSIDVNELIEKAIGFINPRIKSNKIEIEFNKSQTIELEIYTNEMIQVLLNIMSNAIDAYELQENGHKKIKISVEDRRNKIIISIKDNAGGIKKENIKKLFEPYFSTKGKNGTGLGLYMSQMIVEKQLNGKLTLKSSKEETTFMISIPKSLRV